MGVRDIVFKPIGGCESGPQVARFGLQATNEKDSGIWFFSMFYVTRSHGQGDQKCLDTREVYLLLLT